MSPYHVYRPGYITAHWDRSFVTSFHEHASDRSVPDHLGSTEAVVRRLLAAPVCFQPASEVGANFDTKTPVLAGEADELLVVLVEQVVDRQREPQLLPAQRVAYVHGRKTRHLDIAGGIRSVDKVAGNVER